MSFLHCNSNFILLHSSLFWFWRCDVNLLLYLCSKWSSRLYRAWRSIWNLIFRIWLTNWLRRIHTRPILILKAFLFVLIWSEIDYFCNFFKVLSLFPFNTPYMERYRLFPYFNTVVNAANIWETHYVLFLYLRNFIKILINLNCFKTKTIVN